jgi:hypothetical protein
MVIKEFRDVVAQHLPAARELRDVGSQTEPAAATVTTEGTTMESYVCVRAVASQATHSLVTGRRMISMESQCSPPRPPQMLNRAVQAAEPVVTRDAQAETDLGWNFMEQLEERLATEMRPRIRTEVLAECAPVFRAWQAKIEAKAKNAATAMAAVEAERAALRADLERQARTAAAIAADGWSAAEDRAASLVAQLELEDTIRLLQWEIVELRMRRLGD